MTEANNTFTVFRRQVIQTGEYEPAEASCSVTITLNGDENAEEVANLISEWGNTLEMANYEALGVGYELTEQGVRRLSKSVPRSDTADPVATPAAANRPTGDGGPKDDWWENLMNNKGDWWAPNWEKKLDGAFKNLAGPDYKHKNNTKMALWLTAQDGGSIVPNWFACPFTGKSSDDLGMVGKQIRARM